ncbi:MAG: PEGA domain-containing protein [Patescibacteria group bacterium]|nr:PEGA domain-containing protein [Patescibacteria group bacterium]
MSLKKRFLLLGLIFATFILTACGILVFSLGYTFDFTSKKFVATGTLVVYSDPKGAEIFLNNKPTGKTTPATIRLLPPGEYDVRLQKTGYENWEKHFSVIAQQVTWTSERDGKVALFLADTVPIMVSPGAFDLFAMNDETWFAMATSTWQLQNAETRQILPLKLKPRTEETLTITPDANWAISSGSRGVTAAENLSSGDVIALSQFNLNFTQTTSLGKNELILLTAAGRLYQYDLSTKILSSRRATCKSFAVDGDRLYFLDGDSVYVTNRASSTTELITGNLPPGQNSQLIPAGSSGLYALLDGALYRLDPTPRLLEQNVTYAAWDSSSQNLIFGDPHSIWVFDPETDVSPALILRTSNDIASPQINEPTGQTFFLENGMLKAVETRAKLNRRIIEFSTFAPVQKFRISPDGSKLYWLTSDKEPYLMQIR